MKSAIIIVAVLSTALLSQALDPVVKRDVAPVEQAEMLLTRVARAVEFNAYVESNIADCVIPDAAVRTFCNMNYMVPKVFYTRFTTLLNIVRTSFTELERNLSASCSSSLKNTICKASLPQCSADRRTVTFPNYSAGCSNSLSCAVATTTLHIDANFRTMLCGESGRTYSLTRCQSPSVTTYNSAICGNLPSNIKFPEWMVPLIPHQSINIDIFKQRLININATDSCIEQWMKVSCNSIPYCTTDSSKVVGVATTQSCQAALNCITPVYRAQFISSGICNGYPDSNGQRVTVTTQVGYSYSEVKGNHGWRATSNILLICGLSLLSWLLH